MKPIELYEKHRPKRFQDVIAQDKAIRQILLTLRNGWGGKAYWISGPSGCGKTTLARILASVGADDLFVTEFENGKDATPTALRKVFDAMQMSAWGKGGRALIINEAHGLSRDAMRFLLGKIEPVPSNAVVVFTTTQEGQLELFEDMVDANPLLSRCHKVAVTKEGVKSAFAQRAMEIAKLEGLDGGQDIKAFAKVVADKKNNLRDVLVWVEEGRMLQAGDADAICERVLAGID